MVSRVFLLGVVVTVSSVARLFCFVWALFVFRFAASMQVVDRSSFSLRRRCSCLCCFGSPGRCSLPLSFSSSVSLLGCLLLLSPRLSLLLACWLSLLLPFPPCSSDVAFVPRTSWRLLSFSSAAAAAAAAMMTDVTDANGAAATPRCTKSEQPLQRTP